MISPPRPQRPATPVASACVDIEKVFSGIAVAFEAVGALAMIAGFIVAGVLSLRALRRDGGTVAFSVLRNTMGGAILLGLEILVAADLIRTITSKPSIEDAAILGLIVLIRTVLSMSIQIEIDGVPPWKRAYLNNGGAVISRAIAADAKADDNAAVRDQSLSASASGARADEPSDRA